MRLMMLAAATVLGAGALSACQPKTDVASKPAEAKPAEAKLDPKAGAIGQVAPNPNAPTPVDVPSVDVHAIKLETVSAKAPHGGFCGKEKTGFLAMAIPITTPSGLSMAIAAFKGDHWPPKDGGGLCGVYTYNMPH